MGVRILCIVVGGDNDHKHATSLEAVVDFLKMTDNRVYRAWVENPDITQRSTDPTAGITGVIK